MGKSSCQSNLKAYCRIFVISLCLTVTYCAPQNLKSSIFGEVFEATEGVQCEDLKNHGYEGFECTTTRSCGEDGFIERSALEGDLTVWRSDEDEDYDEEHKLDLSKYDCPNVRQVNVDDYYSYEDEEDDEMVCCRSSGYFGKDDIPPLNVQDICKYWEGQGFDCVDKDVCESDGHYNTLPLQRGETQLGIRTTETDVADTKEFESALKSKCENEGKVCCRKDNFHNKPIKTTDATEPEEEEYEDEDYDEENIEQTISSTGKGPVCNINIRKVDKYELAPRISSVQGGAEEAGFGEWPNMCIVLREYEDYKGDSFDLYQCGASLISHGIVLTSAHCVEGKKLENIKVRCGELDAKQNYTESETELKPHQDRKAKHISIHPAFNAKNLYNDFALIHLKIDFDLDEHIYPICLPSQDAVVPLFGEEDCYSMGYGKDSFGAEGYFSDVLKVAPMMPIDSNQCQSQYQTIKPKFQLHKSFLCAQGDGAGTCFGDGGSPLVCPNEDGDYTQFGIVAWGEKGCSGDKPDVFSDVTKALGFIDWATKCVEGQDADLFGLSYFKRWAKRQFCINKNNIQDIKIQLSFANHPNELNLRKEWRQYDYENRHLKSAIKNCKTGPKDIDCNIKDYISNEQDFDQQVERNHDENNLKYDDLLKNDVVERSAIDEILD